MMAAAAAAVASATVTTAAVTTAAVTSAATVAPELIPPPPGQKVLSVRHYEAGPPLPEKGEAALAKAKDANGAVVPGSDGGAELQEEEWVTRKRVELTTTRQTETRVKRQVELDEEGRVVGDSGPIVTTSTTEDTHSEEQKHTEHRAVGPDDEPLPPLDGEVANASTATKALVASAEDGSVLVREVRERKVKSREEKEEVLETEDVVHLGDITDEGYLAAVIENKDVRTATGDTKALASTGPRLVRQSARGHRVVDTEDTEEASVATPDGRLLTETKTQHQHEEEDMEEDDDKDGKDLPDEELEGEGKSHKFVRTKEEEVVSYLADGVKVAEEMKYRAENFEGEKEAGDETDAPRLRALKPRPSKGVPPPSPAGGERKDALTRRPLDLDAEEETRKVETSKWLEHHFGSDSRSSREGSAGGLDDQETPLYGGVTPGGGSYIGITMMSKPNTARQDVPLTREPLRASPVPHVNTNSNFNRVKTPEPLSQTMTNGYHHETETTEVRSRETLRTSGGGTGIIGRKDVVQVLPTGPGRTFRPPRGVAVPPPSTTELVHVEPQKRKKRPQPQPVWTSDVTEDEERVGWNKEGDAVKGNRPWSPEDGSRGGGSPGDDIIGRPITQQYHQTTMSSPSDRSWNRTEEATVSWANGVSENHVMTNGDHHHHDNHVGPPSPAPPPQEGLRVARTRRRAPPIPTHAETNGVRTPETPTPPPPTEKKQPLQKTRFADEEIEEEEDDVAGHSEGHIKENGKEKKKKKVKKKKSGSFGDSIRRLVGRLRSRSSEKKRGKEEQNKLNQQQQKASANSARRGSYRSSSRTPSPDEYCEPTYRRYHTAIDGNIRVASTKQERSHGHVVHHHHHNHRPVGVPRGPESSPNEATSGEEYEEEEHNAGRKGIGGGGPVAPPRARPTVLSQGHSMTQHRGGAESQQQHHRHHHHGGGSSGRRQQVSSSRRPSSPVGRHNESSRGEDRSWRGSSSRRRDYAVEAASSGGGSSSRRRHAYSPERGSAGAPFSSTTSEGESSRRREAERVPPVLATSTPMDYEKRHGGVRGRDDGGNHVQRFYLGEDPFGGSIYGREREYEGVKRSSRQRHEEQKKSGLRYGATLGRPSASAGNHSSTSHSHSDPARAQTLPRKLRHSPPHNSNHVVTSNHVSSSSVRRQLYADSPGIGGSSNHLSKRNGDLHRHTGSLINVSIVNNVTPGTTNRAPPAKPARTYRSNLSRSKSFNVHANQDEVDHLPRPKPVNGEKWESPANRYRSNPQLNRILHEESPLKSPGIISSINRSTKDLRDAVKKEEVTSRYTDLIKKEENGKDGWLKKEWTPSKFRERTGSGGVENGGRSESVRITTVSDGPSVTRTVRNFEKRSSGGDGGNTGGRLETTYEATTTVTESVSRPPSIWNRGRKSLVGPGFGDVPGGGGVVIEVRNGRL